VLGWIDGADPATLQSLSIPTEVEAFRRPQDDRRLAAAQTA
jgi:hypothetical protein